MVSGRFRFRPRKKVDKTPLTRADLQKMQTASKEELLQMQKSLGLRIDEVDNLLRMTPRERLRLLKARMRARRRHG